MKPPRRVLGLAALAVLLSVPFALRALEADPAQRVRAIVSRVRNQKIEQIWGSADALEEIGADALGAIRKAARDPDPKVKLACAKALLSLGRDEDALVLLRALVAEDLPTEIRIAAIRMLGREEDPDLAARLEGILRDATDPALRIAACRTLWDIERSREAVRHLRELLGSRERAIRTEAALALGEIGYIESEPRVKRILASLRDEPTSRGTRARLILEYERLAREMEASQNPFGLSAKETLELKEKKIRELQREIARLGERAAEQTGDGGHPLVAEILKRVRQFYVDPDRIHLKDLYVAAAKGMVQSLDPFSSYMDVGDTKAFEESIRGEYGGIGAHVQLDRAGYLLILKPIYGAPAYKAGLRSRDRILEVEGVPTKGKRLEQIVKYLKGPRGTDVHVKVYRRGWQKPREFTITRDRIQLPSVLHRMLPGRIGYVQLRQFGDGAVRGMERAMDELEKGRMRGLILDLRENPGGLLSAAVRIADMFVGADPRPIVVQKSQRDVIPVQQQPATDEEPQWTQLPLVILVDEMSASASEIVAGALQDYGRATIVGKRTFGKGSVQRLFPLSDEVDGLLGGPSRLRLTVQYYYLPSGRSIHAKRDSNGRVVPGGEGGIRPDIEVAPVLDPMWKLEEFAALAESEALNGYADRLCKGHLEEIRKLFNEGDGYDPSRYPGFEAFYADLKTHLDRNDVRRALRDAIRRRLQDLKGREIPVDFQEDDQLERAILALLDKMGIDPKSIPPYAPFAGKSFHASEDEQEALGIEPETVPVPQE